jgi:hypothetical protein
VRLLKFSDKPLILQGPRIIAICKNQKRRRMTFDGVLRTNHYNLYVLTSNRAVLGLSCMRTPLMEPDSIKLSHEHLEPTLLSTLPENQFEKS